MEIGGLRLNESLPDMSNNVILHCVGDFVWSETAKYKYPREVVKIVIPVARLWLSVSRRNSLCFTPAYCYETQPEFQDPGTFE